MDGVEVLHASGTPVARCFTDEQTLSGAIDMLFPYFHLGSGSRYSSIPSLRCTRQSKRAWSEATDVALHDWSYCREDRAGDEIFISTTSTSKRVWHRLRDAQQITEFSPHEIRVQLAPDATDRQLCRALARAIRVLFAHQQMHDGAILLHASGVVGKSGAVLFTGPKNAGKTTAMLMALRKGFSFLTNDQVLVTRAGFAMGLPIAANIRSGAPSVAGTLQGCTVQPQVLAQHFGQVVVPIAILNAIVKLERKPEGKNELRWLPAKEASAVIEANCFSESSPQQPYWHFFNEYSTTRPWTGTFAEDVSIAHVSYRGDDVSWLLEALE